MGSLDKSDPNVGTGLVGAPECGDVMKLQMTGYAGRWAKTDDIDFYVLEENRGICIK
jgi:NifU-like protein involved in Fe-S cluster formation